jgi:MYND finger
VGGKTSHSTKSSVLHNKNLEISAVVLNFRERKKAQRRERVRKWRAILQYWNCHCQETPPRSMNEQRDDLLSERQHKHDVRNVVGQFVKAARQMRSNDRTKIKMPPAWFETLAEADKLLESKDEEGAEEGAPGSSSPLLEELHAAIMASSGPRPAENTDCSRPAIISSQLIDQIKALSQLSNQTFYVAKVDAFEVDDRPISYWILTVDMSRYQNGKTTSVFKLRQCVVCPPTESHAKCLIASFACACLQGPFVQESESAPCRPAQVFFETQQDADNAQVQMFLSMMGMNSSGIRVATPQMKALLDASMDDVGKSLGRAIFPKAKFPHINDASRGIVCGNCRKTGPKLLKCACGEAYYCSKECQTLAWKNHKQMHKKVQQGAASAIVAVESKH